MNSQLVRLCERVALISLTLAIIASVSAQAPWGWTLGLAAGGLLGLANLMGLRWILTRLLLRVQQQHLRAQSAGEPPQGPQGAGALMGLLMVKMAAAVGAVWVILKIWSLDTLGFGLGLTLVVGTLVVVPLIAPTLPEGPTGGPAKQA